MKVLYKYKVWGFHLSCLSSTVVRQIGSCKSWDQRKFPSQLNKILLWPSPDHRIVFVIKTSWNCFAFNILPGYTVENKPTLWNTEPFYLWERRCVYMTNFHKSYLEENEIVCSFTSCWPKEEKPDWFHYFAVFQ